MLGQGKPSFPLEEYRADYVSIFLHISIYVWVDGPRCVPGCPETLPESRVFHPGISKPVPEARAGHPGRESEAEKGGGRTHSGMLDQQIATATNRVL